MWFLCRSRRTPVDVRHRHVRPALELLESRIVPAGPARPAPLSDLPSPQQQGQLLYLGSVWADSVLANNGGSSAAGRLAADVGLMVTAATQYNIGLGLHALALINTATGYATNNPSQVASSADVSSMSEALELFSFASFYRAGSDFVENFSAFFSQPPSPSPNWLPPFGGVGYNPFGSPFDPPGIGGLVSYMGAGLGGSGSLPGIGGLDGGFGGGGVGLGGGY
jgi:hypothetical protein